MSDTPHMTAVMQQTIHELMEALEPFERVCNAFRPTWQENAPVKAQSNLGPLPTVNQYRELRRKAGLLRALTGSL